MRLWLWLRHEGREGWKLKGECAKRAIRASADQTPSYNTTSNRGVIEQVERTTGKRGGGGPRQHIKETGDVHPIYSIAVTTIPSFVHSLPFHFIQ